MTEQEAEALAARLTRIWEPESVIGYGIHSRNQFDFEGVLYQGEDGEKIAFTVYFTFPNPDGSHPPTQLRWMRFPGTRCNLGGTSKHFLLAAQCDGVIVMSNSARQKEAFLIQWLPFFRRNCWLSGCPIEASMHEKMEWAQGFSREELKAWNLKM